MNQRHLQDRSQSPSQPVATFARKNLVTCKRDRADMPSLFDSQDATAKTPRCHQQGTELAQRSSDTEGSSDEPPAEPSKTGEPRQRIDDRGGQAQSRHQDRTEELQQNHDRGHPQDASDDAILVVGGVGHSSDQGIEPEVDSTQKQAAKAFAEKVRQEERGHTRGPPSRVGILGAGQVSSAEGQDNGHANGTRPIDLLGSTDWNPFCQTESARRCDSAGWTKR